MVGAHTPKTQPPFLRGKVGRRLQILKQPWRGSVGLGTRQSEHAQTPVHTPIRARSIALLELHHSMVKFTVKFAVCTGLAHPSTANLTVIVIVTFPIGADLDGGAVSRGEWHRGGLLRLRGRSRDCRCVCVRPSWAGRRRPGRWPLRLCRCVAGRNKRGGERVSGMKDATERRKESKGWMGGGQEDASILIQPPSVAGVTAEKNIDNDVAS